MKLLTATTKEIGAGDYLPLLFLRGGNGKYYISDDAIKGLLVLVEASSVDSISFYDNGGEYHLEKTSGGYSIERAWGRLLL